MTKKASKSSMRRTNMYFSTQQMEKLFALSSETGLSVAEIVRRAVDKYIRKTIRNRTDVRNECQ